MIDDRKLRFVVVRIHGQTFAHLHQWRATAIKDDGKAIEMWFWVPDLIQAKLRVRCKFPNATFSDEEYLKEQPVRARAFADGQPISDSNIPIPPDDDEALNVAARGAAD